MESEVTVVHIQADLVDKIQISQMDFIFIGYQVLIGVQNTYQNESRTVVSFRNIERLPQPLPLSFEQ